MEQNKTGSHKNIWHGVGRQRIEIPKSVLKSRIQNNQLLKQLYICGLGYYPRAADHYTYRKKGLPENFLFYCVDGHGWYTLGDKRYEVGPNECFILPSHTEHAYGSSKDDPWTIYWLHFGGNLLANFNQLPVIQKHYKPNPVRSSNEMVTLFSKIYKTLELGYSIDNLLFANMCLPQYIGLFIYNQKYFETSPALEKLDCIDSAILFMQEHINENITLGDLSHRYNYSPSRFSSLFKQRTGYAPIDYFIQMKMQRASQHLGITDKSIKDIALSMGFDDPYYFSKRFTKVMGMSPTKYRSVTRD